MNGLRVELPRGNIICLWDTGKDVLVWFSKDSHGAFPAFRRIPPDFFRFWEVLLYDLNHFFIQSQWIYSDLYQNDE